MRMPLPSGNSAPDMQLVSMWQYQCKVALASPLRPIFLARIVVKHSQRNLKRNRSNLQYFFLTG